MSEQIEAMRSGLTAIKSLLSRDPLSEWAQALSAPAQGTDRCLLTPGYIGAIYGRVHVRSDREVGVCIQAAPRPPVVRHLPADDTEGGAL